MVLSLTVSRLRDGAALISSNVRPSAEGIMLAPVADANVSYVLALRHSKERHEGAAICGETSQTGPSFAHCLHPYECTCEDPTVMWCGRHDDGRCAHAVIVPVGANTVAVLFIHASPLESREFYTLHQAIQWVERELVKLQVSGCDLWEPPEGATAAGFGPQPHLGEETRH